MDLEQISYEAMPKKKESNPIIEFYIANILIQLRRLSDRQYYEPTSYGSPRDLIAEYLQGINEVRGNGKIEGIVWR